MNESPVARTSFDHILWVLQLAALLAWLALIEHDLERISVALETANATQTQAAATFTTEQRAILETVIAEKMRRKKSIDEIAALFKTPPPPREKLLIEVIRDPSLD